MGGVARLLRFSFFQQAVAAINGKVLTPKKASEWAPIAQALLAACEVQDIGPAGSIEGEVQMWLREFVSTRGIAETPEDGIGGRMPFTDRKGRLCMQLEPFLQWLRFAQSERAANTNISKRLRIFGAEPVTVNIHSETAQSGWTTKRVWYMPRELLDREIDTTRSINVEDTRWYQAGQQEVDRPESGSSKGKDNGSNSRNSPE